MKLHETFMEANEYKTSPQNSKHVPPFMGQAGVAKRFELQILPPKSASTTLRLECNGVVHGAVCRSEQHTRMFPGLRSP